MLAALPLCPLKRSVAGRVVIRSQIAVDDDDAGARLGVSICRKTWGSMLHVLDSDGD